MGRAAILGLALTPSNFANAPPGIHHYFRVAAIDDGATPLLWWVVSRERYRWIENTLIGNHWVSKGFDKAQELIHRLAQTPDGETVAPALDDEFARLATDISHDRFATFLLLPIQRAAWMWWRWLGYGHRIVLTSWGELGLLKFLYGVYYFAVGAGLVAACLAKDRMLNIIAIAAFSVALVRTAFLVSYPVSALEIRYLDLFSPTLDIIGLYGLWQLLPSRLMRPRKLVT